jgi:hypothetical protein
MRICTPQQVWSCLICIHNASGYLFAGFMLWTKSDISQSSGRFAPPPREQGGRQVHDGRQDDECRHSCVISIPVLPVVSAPAPAPAPVPPPPVVAPAPPASELAPIPAQRATRTRRRRLRRPRATARAIFFLAVTRRHSRWWVAPRPSLRCVGVLLVCNL